MAKHTHTHTTTSGHSGFGNWVSELAGQDRNRCLCATPSCKSCRAPSPVGNALGEYGPWCHCRASPLCRLGLLLITVFCASPSLSMPPAGRCCREELGAQRTRSEWPWSTSQVETEAYLQWTSLPWRTAVKVTESDLPLHSPIACCLKCVSNCHHD